MRESMSFLDCQALKMGKPLSLDYDDKANFAFSQASVQKSGFRKATIRKERR